MALEWRIRTLAAIQRVQRDNIRPQEKGSGGLLIRFSFRSSSIRWARTISLNEEASHRERETEEPFQCLLFSFLSSNTPIRPITLTSSMAAFCARYLRSAGAAMAPQRIAPAVATDATAATATSSDLLLRPPAPDDEAELVVVVVEGPAPSIRTLRARRKRGERGRDLKRERVEMLQSFVMPTFRFFFLCFFLFVFFF